VSKINTAAQIALAAYVLADLAFGFAQPAITEAAILAVAATTLISGAAYVATWWRKVNEWERNDSR
jgi:cardiolipin synthase